MDSLMAAVKADLVLNAPSVRERVAIAHHWKEHP
jgi:hypothetical protein